MKKSFKKAGAAVLSMSMLLAMGAVSMPVYADNPTGATPGAVKVSMPGIYKQGQGDSADVDQNTPNALKYDYLDLAGVNSADVKMYRVATLGTDGWKWGELFRGTVSDAHPNTTEGFTSWEDLLAQVGGNGEDKDFFTYSSDDLQKIASYLERVIRDSTTEDLADYYVGHGVLNNGTPYVTIPGDDSLVNEIGYYILVTDTNQAGVVIQPVLVSLKNGQNPLDVSLKGTTIGIEKTITKVADTEDGYEEDDSISTSGDSAVVAKDDTVSYQIVAQLPTYDEKVEATDIRDYVIEDIADSGIKIDPETVKVYLSNDNSLTTTGEGADTLLVANTATAATKNNDYVYADTANGFTVTVKGNQMLGESEGSSLTSPATMQGKYIIITFDATVNEIDAGTGDYKFDRTYTDHVTAETVTEAQYTAVSENDITDAINKNLYGAEADDGAFENETLTTAGIVLTDEYTNVTAIDPDDPTAGPKQVYVTDAGTDTFVEAEAAIVNGVAKKKQAATISNLRNRVRVLLARDAANASNGNENKAVMTYGNEYATGGGEASDNDNTKLYSVDLNLDKKAQQLWLTEAAQITDEAGVLEWLGLESGATAEQILAALQEKAATVTDTPAEETYDGAMSSTLVTMSGNALTTADANKVASLIKTENAAREAANGYNATNKTEVVTNAVFKLTKVYDNDDSDEKLIGYAASDENGDLRVLAESTVEKYNAYKAGTGASGLTVIKVEEDLDDDGEKEAYYYEYTAASELAWKMLTKGTYQLEEVYAPAGYKVFNGVAEFVIDAKQDDLSDEYTGEFGATSGSDLFRDIDGRAMTAADKIANPVEFNFVGADGELKQNVYNELADTLPATGGIGTVLFTAGGISIVLIAGALFVMYMKKRNSEEEE